MQERFGLGIDIGNDAVQTPSDVADLLDKVADKLRATDEWDGKITDANGNTVGEHRNIWIPQRSE